MSTFEKTLAMEDFTRGNLFQTAKPGTLIRLRGHIQKSAAHPVWLSVHFLRLDMLTSCWYDRLRQDHVGTSNFPTARHSSRGVGRASLGHELGSNSTSCLSRAHNT